MSTTILEQCRLAHEEVERSMGAIVKELRNEPKTHKEKILQQHRVNNRLERIKERSDALLTTYEDEDGSRKEEIAHLGQADMFGMFYTRLREIREYHKKFPNIQYEEDLDNVEVTPEEDANLLAKFSGEESYGRYLDLHALHQKFTSMPGFPALEYQMYTQRFDQFDILPLKLRTSAAYRDYLDELLTYLVAYHRRAMPLQDLDSVLAEAETDIAEELANLGEQEHGEDELFCEACNKQFASKGVFESHLKGKKHLKAAKQAALQAVGAGESKRVQLRRQIFRLEKMVAVLGEILQDQVEATTLNIQKKQSRTYAELEAEQDPDAAADEVEEEESEEEDEKPIYNPKGVPLVWDGKPIPYWLYKLHGLNIEYKCEICGNFSYWGPRAFELHFQEWRHAHGMRCLEIPNTREFQNITQIQDAIDLHRRLQSLTQEGAWKPDVEEEFEDADGNVLNKKTYEDLRRQGLL